MTKLATGATGPALVRHLQQPHGPLTPKEDAENMPIAQREPQSNGTDRKDQRYLPLPLDKTREDFKSEIGS